jgi:hypothetical protein
VRWSRDGRRVGTVVQVDPLLLVVAQIDLHSTGPAWLWQAVSVVALVSFLVVLLRWWFSQRKR